MTPSTQGTNKACTTDVQGMYKGYTRVVQGTNTLAIPEQCRSNAGATHSLRACLMGASWVLRYPETGCPAVAGLPSCRAQCRLLQNQTPSTRPPRVPRGPGATPTGASCSRV